MTYILPEEALKSDIAILGKKGRGKSYTAKGIVEHLLDLGQRVLILDPLGHWWGLKSSANGEKPGYPIAVFGGHHADIQIADTSGRRLAELLVSESFPAIVDMSTMRKAEQHRLVGDLLDELFVRNRCALTIVLEEADAFAPQSPMGDAVRVLSEVDRIARRGRAYGFRLISITQRPAKLNKDVLTQLSVLIALGVTSPQDRDAIRSWVEGNGDRDQAKAVYDSLALLPPGEGWVWAPDFNILRRERFPAIKTLDTSSTPEAGSTQIQPKRLAKADIARLSALLCDPAHECAALSDKASPALNLDSAALALAEARAFERGKREGEKIGRALAREEMQTAAARVRSAITSALDELVAASEDEKSIQKIAIDGLSRRRPAAQPKASSSSTLNANAELFLRAAITVDPVQMTWGQLGVLCHRKTRGGSFNTAKKQLIDQAFIEEQRGLVGVTAAGFEQVQAAKRKTSLTKGALIDLFDAVLPTPAKEIFKVLATEGRPLSATDLAKILNRAPRGGSWNTGMAILKNNSLIVETAAGFVLADLVGSPAKANTAA